MLHDLVITGVSVNKPISVTTLPGGAGSAHVVGAHSKPIISVLSAGQISPPVPLSPPHPHPHTHLHHRVDVVSTHQQRLHVEWIH